MSRKQFSIWWVDDQTERLNRLAIQSIENGVKFGKRTLRAKVDVVRLKTPEDRDAFEKKLDAAERDKNLPHLIVMDQNLNVPEGLRGSNLAVAIRADYSSVPVVGVTAVEFQKIVDLQRDQFIELFCLDDLQSGDRVPDLFAIAESFEELVRNYSSSGTTQTRTTKILKWLACPPDDSEFLAICLPGAFLAKWDIETPHSFARWVWHTFIGRAGFLYDDLEIATMLGVKESGLKHLLSTLSDCEYEGLFASNSPTRRRWWVSKVRRVIRKASKAAMTDPLWTLGRKLITDKHSKDFSHCHGARSKSCVPDVVAYSDDTLNDRVQARNEDTQPVQTDTPPVGFEQRRVFSRR
ncbi:MAG TPA: response regulator [Chthoniobacterales bacterium]|nr:response regulator [Chthoniobacterales bacterium]